jgi:hypothetical protein
MNEFTARENPVWKEKGTEVPDARLIELGTSEV